MESISKANFRNRQKNKKGDYAAAYLKKNECEARQCVYISRRIHEIVSGIVRITTNSNVTVGGYLDHILMEHLEAHKEEINELYNKELEKRTGKKLMDF